MRLSGFVMVIRKKSFSAHIREGEEQIYKKNNE
jgi:hypothetical protein